MSLYHEVGLYDNYCNQDVELISHHKAPCDIPLRSHPLLLSHCLQPLAITNLGSISIIVSLQKCHRNGIVQYVTF